MKLTSNLLRSLPSFAAPVFSLAVITFIALTAFYSMAATSMTQIPDWTPIPIHPVQETSETDTSQLQPRWRMTQHGWQDANQWVKHEVTTETQSVFHCIHPTLWAADVLLASVAAVIWATEDEHQLARLWGRC